MIKVFNEYKVLIVSGDLSAAAIVKTRCPVLLYINYKKGTETGVEFTFELKDDRVGDYYPLQIYENNTLSDYKIVLSETGKYRTYVPVSQNEGYLRINIKLVGSPIVSPGSVLCYVVPVYLDY